MLSLKNNVPDAQAASGANILLFFLPYLSLVILLIETFSLTNKSLRKSLASIAKDRIFYYLATGATALRFRFWMNRS